MKSDKRNDNRYWYYDGRWRFWLKKLQCGIMRSGEVINIVDGDTIDISPVDFAGVQRIRLACIDTPNIYEEGYKEAKEKEYVIAKCLGKVVEFEIDDVTQYGYYNRIIAVIYIDGKNLNGESLNEGYAEMWKCYNSSESEFNPYEWVIIDTGESENPYPSIYGIHHGTIAPKKKSLYLSFILIRVTLQGDIQSM